MLAAGAMKSVELMEENPKMFSDLRCVYVKGWSKWLIGSVILSGGGYEFSQPRVYIDGHL